jgi:hypothetical protein
VGNNDRCFIDLLDDGLSHELLVLARSKLLLVAEALVASSIGLLSLRELVGLLSLKKLIGLH